MIFSVVGARPHFVKASPLMNALKNSAMDVFSIHTGQHYDANMSDIFYQELGISSPDVNLGIGSGTHAEQTSAVLTGVERLLLEMKPSAVVVYGDTNSTLGAALAAAKYYVPVVHIEAGVRCGNRRMPEEINRRVIDHVSDVLACPSELAVNNLAREGVVEGVLNVGDFMYDTFLMAKEIASSYSFSLDRLGLCSGEDFVLATIHREESTASAATLSRILDELEEMGFPVVLPLHPRSRSVLETANIPLERSDSLRIVPPVGYLEMMFLLSHAKVVVTDSGGLQKEAYWAGVPCVTLMNETTWPETIDAGWNVLVDLQSDSICDAIRDFTGDAAPVGTDRPEVYGAPGAAQRLVNALGWA